MRWLAFGFVTLGAALALLFRGEGALVSWQNLGILASGAGLGLLIWNEIYSPPLDESSPSLASMPGTWAVVLEDAGEKTIQVIKALRDTTGAGLKETKNLVDAAPVRVVEGASSDVAHALVERLQRQGARATAIDTAEQ